MMPKYRYSAHGPMQRIKNKPNRIYIQHRFTSTIITGEEIPQQMIGQ
jgi:hypothetical protein